jgi:RNA polymerase sigma-70 factor (ECF subfamily)
VSDAATGHLIDRLLILRCQAGDEAALGELIATYSPRVRLYLRKMTRDPATADDLLQETWFDLYRTINRLRRPEAFVAWLYRIARDKVYRELRRRRVPIAVGEPEELASAVPAAGDDETFTPEDAEAVRAALDALPEPQREVLVLRFVEVMTYEQIADVLDRPLGTVRSRIHYARLALRAALEARGRPAGRKDHGHE